MEFWWIPLKGEWMDLHRKCKNKKTKNITCWGIDFIKNWCFSKCKISQHFVNPFIPLLKMFFSKILKLLILLAKILFLVSKSIFFFQTIHQSISRVSQSILVFILTLKIDSWILLWLRIGLTIEKTQLLFVNLVFNLNFFFLFWHDSLSMAKNRDWINTSNH